MPPPDAREVAGVLRVDVVAPDAVAVAGAVVAMYPTSASMPAALVAPTTRRACLAGCGRRLRAGLGVVGFEIWSLSMEGPLVEVG